MVVVPSTPLKLSRDLPPMDNFQAISDLLFLDKVTEQIMGSTPSQVSNLAQFQVRDGLCHLGG